MTKKRHSIDTIAEVLIDKLNDLEHTAQRIEKATEKELKLDVKEVRSLVEMHKKTLHEQNKLEKSFLSDLKAFNDKNRTRVPNWVFALLCALFFTSLGSIYYSWKKAESYDYQKNRADFFEAKYQEILDAKKP